MQAEEGERPRGGGSERPQSLKFVGGSVRSSRQRQLRSQMAPWLLVEKADDTEAAGNSRSCCHCVRDVEQLADGPDSCDMTQLRTCCLCAIEWKHQMPLPCSFGSV